MKSLIGLAFSPVREVVQVIHDELTRHEREEIVRLRAEVAFLLDELVRERSQPWYRRRR